MVWTCGCLESCYWHLVEKRFCYDKDIAAYEDPNQIKRESHHNSSFENLSYYDQVSIIAGRSIVTIDALPPKPIESQPKPRKRWWEDDADQKDGKNEHRNNNTVTVKDEETTEQKPIIPTILIEPADNISQNVEDNFKKNNAKTYDPKTAKVTGKDAAVKLRKKSLHERRISRSLTLSIFDPPVEVPIIRQTSIPKFYIETPEVSHQESSIWKAPSTALSSPVAPRDNGFDFFDLKSVVQLENEIRSSTTTQQASSTHKSSHSPFHSVREKLNPIAKLKHHSSHNVPHSINHM